MAAKPISPTLEVEEINVAIDLQPNQPLLHYRLSHFQLQFNVYSYLTSFNIGNEQLLQLHNYLALNIHSFEQP